MKKIKLITALVGIVGIGLGPVIVVTSCVNNNVPDDARLDISSVGIYLKQGAPNQIEILVGNKAHVTLAEKNRIATNGTVIDVVEDTIKDMLGVDVVYNIDYTIVVEKTKVEDFTNFCDMTLDITARSSSKKIRGGFHYKVGVKAITELIIPYNTYVNEVNNEIIGWKSGFIADYGNTLIIPDNVTAIQDNAFQNTNGLYAIKFDNAASSVCNYIGSFAFQSSTLEYIGLPNNLLTLGWEIFDGCTLDIENFENTRVEKLPFEISRYGHCFTGARIMNDLIFPGSFTDDGSDRQSGYDVRTGNINAPSLDYSRVTAFSHFKTSYFNGSMTHYVIFNNAQDISFDGYAFYNSSIRDIFFSNGAAPDSISFGNESFVGTSGGHINLYKEWEPTTLCIGLTDGWTVRYI